MPNRLAITRTVNCFGDLNAAASSNIASYLSKAAVLSLYKEVSLYPKPGLVSPIDSGSHVDMNYQMFLASINSLRGYFGEISRAGMAADGFSALQTLGIAAETRMMQATRGVNTHRGAIFNLGLLCAAAGYLLYRDEPVSPEALGDVILEKWAPDILATGKTKAYAEYSHGQQVASKYGVQGARHEAVAGFPAARQHGLPAYRRALKETGCREASAVQALFSMMAYLDDTNILWRGGEKGLHEVKTISRNFLNRGGVYAKDWRSQAIQIHQRFVKRNLSPGGAADLLGVTLFMDAICA